MCATVAACGGGTVRSGEPAATAAGLTDGNGSGGVESDIERIREATSAFRSLDAAVAAEAVRLEEPRTTTHEEIR